MKRLHVIRVELPKQQNEIEVHVIADVHLSDPNCDIRGVQKRVADIAAKDNAYAILAGDLIDNATRNSIGDIYSTQLSPMEQIQLANKTFAPLKGRILCAVPGNHEERTYRADGIDIYVCGHTHSPAVFKDCFFRANASTRSAEPVERLFVNTAAALDYGGGYGVRMGYQPASKAAPVIYLDGWRKNAGAAM